MMDGPACSSAEDADPRAEWDRRLKLGQCTLADAVMMSAHQGLPLSAYVVARLEGAFAAYACGDSDDLAEPFGLKMLWEEKKRQERITFVSHVRFIVDGFHHQGLPMTPSRTKDRTAFDAASELLHKSPSHLYDLYYGRRK